MHKIKYNNNVSGPVPATKTPRLRMVLEWKNYFQFVGNCYPLITILNMMYVRTVSGNGKYETN